MEGKRKREEEKSSSGEKVKVHNQQMERKKRQERERDEGMKRDDKARRGIQVKRRWRDVGWIEKLEKRWVR